MTFAVAVGQLVLLAVGVIIFIRTNIVYRYRMRLLDRVSAAAQRDINRHLFTAWKERFRLLEGVSFATMVWQFWRPCNSFWGEENLRLMTEDRPEFGQALPALRWL